MGSVKSALESKEAIGLTEDEVVNLGLDDYNRELGELLEFLLRPVKSVFLAEDAVFSEAGLDPRLANYGRSLGTIMMLKVQEDSLMKMMDCETD